MARQRSLARARSRRVPRCANEWLAATTRYLTARRPGSAISAPAPAVTASRSACECGRFWAPAQRCRSVLCSASERAARPHAAQSPPIALLRATRCRRRPPRRSGSLLLRSSHSLAPRRRRAGRIHDSIGARDLSQTARSAGRRDHRKYAPPRLAARLGFTVDPSCHYRSAPGLVRGLDERSPARRRLPDKGQLGGAPQRRHSRRE